MSSISPTDAWVPRPADLPPAEIVGRAPELADLENNVVFRSMLFGRRTRRSMPRFESSVGLFVLLLTSAVLLSCFGPLFFFIAFPLNRFFRKPQANVIAFFGMPEVLLRELIELRVPAHEWTMALWGRAVTRRAQRASAYLTLAGILLLIGYALILLPDTIGMFAAALHASVAYLLGLRFGTTLAGINRAAHLQLPALLRRVRRFRRATLLSNNPLGWLYALALIVGVMLIWLLLAVIFSVLAASTRSMFPRPIDLPGADVWFIPVSTVILPLALGLVTGAGVVWVRLRSVQARAGEYIDEMNEEVEGMLRIMQSRFDFEGEERPDIPRLNYRPSGAAPVRSRSNRTPSMSPVSVQEGEGP